MARRAIRIQRRFGERLRELREAGHLSQEELAYSSDITRQYVNQIEQGKANPSMLVLARIAETLKVPLHELMRLD